MATIKGHKPKCQCAFCGPGGNATHKTGCQCPVCNKLGGNNMDHKPDCQCPFCTKSGSGNKHHKPDCGCPWCNTTHKPDCQCPFCGPGGNATHKTGCQCPFCEPPSHAPWANTGIELAMQELLTELGVEFETQMRVGPYRVDIYVPSRGLMIECDGEYWHKFEDPKKRSRRDSYIRRQGFSLWHFTGSEINNGCGKRLRRALMH